MLFFFVFIELFFFGFIHQKNKKTQALFFVFALVYTITNAQKPKKHKFLFFFFKKICNNQKKLVFSCFFVIPGCIDQSKKPNNLCFFDE